MFDLVTFSTTLNSLIEYLPKTFFLNTNIVLYNIVQNLRALFSCSLTILISVIYVKVVYTNKDSINTISAYKNDNCKRTKKKDL